MEQVHVISQDDGTQYLSLDGEHYMRVLPGPPNRITLNQLQRWHEEVNEQSKTPLEVGVEKHLWWSHRNLGWLEPYRHDVTEFFRV